MDSFSIPAGPNAAVAIRDFVEQAATAAGLAGPHLFRLSLAVEEIAYNIVTHGYAAAGRGGDIQVRIERKPDRLAVTLEDQGIPFDPSSRQPPSPADLALPVEDRTPGGLGVFLALRSLDGFHYDYIEGRNRNTLEVRLP